MADANYSIVENIYVSTYTRVFKKTGNRAQAEKAAVEAVRKSNWYIDNGVWKKAKPGMKPKQKQEFTNRSDENRKLASIRVRPTRMA